MRIAFRILYLGTAFFGSQIQPDLRTVEGEFIEACRRLDLFEDWKAAALVFAGRTDRGVHARGQVCAFTTDRPERAIALLNVQLPRDCQAAGYCEVPEGFHPRFDAVSRTYRYYWTDQFPERAHMDRVARMFQGEHDFSSFARIEAGHDPVRCVFSSHVFSEGDYTVFEITAASFLWNMVRCMASALESVGTGNSGEERILHLLQERCPRPAATPAEGLVLWNVDCGIDFLPLSPAPRSRAYFDEMWRYHRRMDRISRIVAGQE
ncbi:MAG: tRNA pseudouridine(38-40) synthase TruA [Methanomicrobiales archaeon]|nr:tRNA pseudouridine(38-40) synthase TruA [Methanomicrobiales archaeon]